MKKNCGLAGAASGIWNLSSEVSGVIDEVESYSSTLPRRQVSGGGLYRGESSSSGGAPVMMDCTPKCAILSSYFSGLERKLLEEGLFGNDLFDVVRDVILGGGCAASKPNINFNF